MKKTKERIFLILSIVLCLLLFCIKWTGSVVHLVLGVILVIISVKHIFANKAKLPYVPKNFRLVDNILIGILLIMVISGIFIHPMQAMGVDIPVKIVHKLLGLIFFIGLIVHVVQHIKNRKVKV